MCDVIEQNPECSQSPTPIEVERLISAARRVGRYGARDATLVLLMYRHGFRVAEVSRLRWAHVDMQAALLHVRRRKHGVLSCIRCMVRNCEPYGG